MVAGVKVAVLVRVLHTVQLLVTLIVVSLHLYNQLTLFKLVLVVDQKIQNLLLLITDLQVGLMPVVAAVES